MMLEIHDLAVARGGVPVLEGLNFTLTAGHALIIRGPNGAGKTTLLRCLAGLQPALAGEISGGGEEIAYSGHSDGLKAMLSVRENLRFWADIFDTSQIEPALDAFQLETLKDRLAGTLSAGQKRRLGLARMLVTGRSVWVMDEPTVSLDAASTELFAGAVRGHLSGGGLAVIATHIDLGLPEASVFDVSDFTAKAGSGISSDEAFL